MITIRNLYRKSLLLLAPLAAGSAFIEPKKLPLSILVGGALALLNLKGLSRGLESLIGTHRPTLKLMALGVFRLVVLSAIIILLAYFRLVNLVGFLAGFSVVHVLLLYEGYRTAREAG
jgi:hypothetical protein